jgi:hypothetical protein
MFSHAEFLWNILRSWWSIDLFPPLQIEEDTGAKSEVEKNCACACTQKETTFYVQ